MKSLMAKLGSGVERRMTSGNIWTMIVAIASVLGGTGYEHFNPSDATRHAAQQSDIALEQAAAAAARSAVVEEKVTTHSQELLSLNISMTDIKTAVAVLQSQSDAAKTLATEQSTKLDQILEAVYRMQGAQIRATMPSTSRNLDGRMLDPPH